MKHLLLALLAAAPLLAAADEASDIAAERARIAAERSRAEAQFKAQERVCWGKFAVNECLSEAKTKRRTVLADLRRQEVALNDQVRKQLAAERLRSLEERTAPTPRQVPSGKAPADPAQRDSQAAERAAAQASRQATRDARPDPRQEAQRRAAQAREAAARKEAERAGRLQQAAENVKEREKLEKEAQEHREALARRLASRQKPPAAPLPAPPD